MKAAIVLVISLVLGGCAAKAPRAADSSPQIGSSSSAATAQLWIVEPFKTGEGWLPADASDEIAQKAWGKVLADKIEARLSERNLESLATGHELTSQEIKAWMDQGLAYLCRGKLVSLKVESGQAQLRVVYRLDRRMHEEVKPVQVRRAEVSRPAEGALTPETVDGLLEDAAAKVADGMIADIPADLVSERG